MIINATARSWFRFTALSLFHADVYLKNAGEYNSIVRSATGPGETASLFAILVPGVYELEIIADESGSSEADCPSLNVEMSLKRSSDISALPSDIAIRYPPNLHQLPYLYSSSPLYAEVPLSLPKDRHVWEWNFEVRETASFTAELNNDFITSDMNLALVYGEGAETMSDSSNVYEPVDMQYNYARLQKDISPGKYTLQLRVPSGSGHSPIASIEFGLTIIVLPVQQGGSGEGGMECFKGEPIPESLSTIRFMTGRKSFHYHSDSFRVPGLQNEASAATITFTGPDIIDGGHSSLRVFTENHRVDIDLRLRDVTVADRPVTVANGNNVCALIPDSVICICLSSVSILFISLILNMQTLTFFLSLMLLRHSSHPLRMECSPRRLLSSLFFPLTDTSLIWPSLIPIQRLVMILVSYLGWSYPLLPTLGWSESRVRTRAGTTGDQTN